MTLTADTSKSRSLRFFRRLLTNKISSPLIAVLMAVVFTWIMLLIMKAPPMGVLQTMIRGSLGSADAITQVIQAWIPLMLVSCGLMFTFTSGLWNIGMEGQVEMGAICAYAVIHYMTGTGVSGAVVVMLSFVSGILGGVIWALLVALLKNFGGVNEIFGGLGFNFIADAVLLFLVYGPWKPAGVAQGSTKMIDGIYWLPQFPGTYLSPWGLAFAILGIAITVVLLKGTFFGLKLKAVGKNPKAAFMMGIATNRYMLSSFLICGIFAGITGALQVTGFLHVLRSGISGSYGYMGLMVGMLANYQTLVAVPIAFVFSILSKGAVGLGIDLKLDSNLSGVIQGSLVLFVLLMDGVRKRLTGKTRGA